MPLNDVKKMKQCESKANYAFSEKKTTTKKKLQKESMTF